ncbi:exported hypothetical protein [Chryseobacterium sp. 8AT]|nr:exported hypothetical protein [Chryseobacterium sp. 8AT]
MKKILIPIGALLLSGLVNGQVSPAENYVYKRIQVQLQTIKHKYEKNTYPHRSFTIIRFG